MKDMSDMYKARVDGPGPDDCELYALGSSPDLPLGDINLAGVDGVPEIEDVVDQDLGANIYQPDFIVPCMDMPNLSMTNLADSPIDIPTEFAPDKLMPDLSAIPDPYSMDVYTNDLMPAQPDLAQDIPSDAEIAAGTDQYPWMAFQGLDTTRTYDQPDPLMPELQNLDTTQDVTMDPSDRPGEMSPNALEMLDEQPELEEGGGSLPPYKNSFTDQAGDNDRRARHMDLLLTGLKEPGSLM